MVPTWPLATSLPHFAISFQSRSRKKGINSKFPADGLCTKMSGYQRLPTYGTFLCRGQGTYPRSRRTTLTLYIRILFIHNSHSVLKKPDIISIVYRVAERHQKLSKPFMISQLKIFIDNTRNIAFNYFENCVLRYVFLSCSGSGQSVVD